MDEFIWFFYVFIGIYPMHLELFWTQFVTPIKLLSMNTTFAIILNESSKFMCLFVRCWAIIFLFSPFSSWISLVPNLIVIWSSEDAENYMH